MNNLNSVLIEGECFGEVKTLGEAGQRDFTAYFTIKSVRRYKAGDEVRKEENLVGVEAGGKLAEGILKYLCNGRGVRVVGRLRVQDGKAVAVAEHVEFRPEPGTSQKEETL